jgi:hypothetical protein
VLFAAVKRDIIQHKQLKQKSVHICTGKLWCSSEVAVIELYIATFILMYHDQNKLTQTTDSKKNPFADSKSSEI